MIGRVLMTADTLGGVFTYAVTLAHELVNRGVSVHLATMGGELRPEQRARIGSDVVLHESTYALEWMDDPWSDVELAGRWLLALERDVRPDVVQINGYAHGALPFLARRVVVAHSCVLSWWEAVHREPAPERYRRYRDEVSRGLGLADDVVAISAAMRDALSKHYELERPVSIVHNGIAPASSSTSKEPFVLSCGRLWDRAKNVESLARIAPRLSWPVKVAGWGADEPSGLIGLGWLGHEALGRVMDRAAIFALPARYEPFGLSAIEAALRGCAVVVGDIESQREVWGDAALFVAPDDHDGLHAAIERLASDAMLRAELATRARNRALRYSASRMTAAMLDIYEGHPCA
jgi:glycosyltransferase involved in cell wall biosynthesis